MDSKNKKPNSVREEDKEIGVSGYSFENAKVIQWEDYEQELARCCSLASALEEAKQKKLQLQEKLNSLIQVIFLFFKDPFLVILVTTVCKWADDFFFWKLRLSIAMERESFL